MITTCSDNLHAILLNTSELSCLMYPPDEGVVESMKYLEDE